MKRLLCVGLLSTLVACSGKKTTAPDGSNTGILGGDTVAADQPAAKHVALLRATNGKDEYICTAVLIARNTVLTAAHCGADLQQGELLFSTDLSTDEEDLRRPVVEVHVQPKFGQTMQRLQDGQAPRGLKNWGDLAILKFSGRTPRGFRSVQIGDGTQLSDGQTVLLAGYGQSNTTDPNSAGQLRQVEVRIKKANYSKDEFTVDQSEGEGACHGDSGGPAFVTDKGKLYLVGITSRGTANNCQREGIYTRVSPFVDWINQILDEKGEEAETSAPSLSEGLLRE